VARVRTAYQFEGKQIGLGFAAYVDSQARVLIPHVGFVSACSPSGRRMGSRFSMPIMPGSAIKKSEIFFVASEFSSVSCFLDSGSYLVVVQHQLHHHGR
jgi:hypothetical protein